jgi:pyruvate dehydrogenase complex dehydrogenase (E1) component
MLGVRCVPLGVTDYGQSGTPEDLYREFKIESDSIACAAFTAIGGEHNFDDGS